jgi:hypothetical protein
MNKPVRSVAVDYGAEQAAMQVYLKQGAQRAFALGNRGPIRFAADGNVHPDILDAYWRRGFYIFEGVLAPDELADIEADVKGILDYSPHAAAGEIWRWDEAAGASMKDYNLLDLSI